MVILSRHMLLMFGYLQFRGIVFILPVYLAKKKIYEEQFPLFPPFVSYQIATEK